MAIAFDLLPVELQASIVELRHAQVPEAAIDTLIARTLQALGQKSNKVQAEVWQMEERLGKQLTQIGDKLQSDLQTQHGATNGMLIELRNAQLEAHPQIREARQDVADLKKAWAELESWRSRIEAALLSFEESRDESKKERATIQTAIRKLNDRLKEIERLLEIAGSHEAER